MQFKCCEFIELARDIKMSQKKVMLFGAGVIGQITTPEILKEFGVWHYIDCYLDNDEKKWGSFITIDGKDYEIRSPEYLKSYGKNTIVLLNISRFSEVKDQLEKMDCTQEMAVYIIPMMCIHNWCSDKSIGRPILSEVPQIPKVINYMWLGGKSIPSNLQRCIDSWRYLCPDYEIIEWNENNYDIDKHPYMKQAYMSKAYGFVPDYARLDILYNNGGFYLDTDVELKLSLDEMRYQEAFVGVEKWQVLNFGGCSGAIKGHPMIKKFIDSRENVFFIDKSGNQNKNTCGFYDTKVALDNGYKINGTTQCINGMNVYGYDYFHPYDYMSGILTETINTRSVHYFNGGWLDGKMKEQNELTKQKYLDLYRKSIN